MAAARGGHTPSAFSITLTQIFQSFGRQENPLRHEILMLEESEREFIRIVLLFLFCNLCLFEYRIIIASQSFTVLHCRTEESSDLRCNILEVGRSLFQRCV